MTNERRKITVGLLFGGRSAEHEVSRASAANILRALNSDRYDVYLIGISRDGRWFACDSGNGAGTGSTALTISDEAPEIGLVPGGRGRLVHCDGPTGSDAGSIDVAFPILHGPNGEDGTVQGALEFADVSFVGSSVTGSAVAMDKEVSKRLMRDAGLPVVPFLTTTASSRIEYAAAVAALGTSDLFVKPANLGIIGRRLPRAVRGGIRSVVRSRVPLRPQDPGRASSERSAGDRVFCPGGIDR